MPVRATKRGAERTPLDAATSTSSSAARRSPVSRSRASCAAPARACWCSTATRSASARPRACAAPTEWLEHLGLEDVDPADVRRRSSSTRPHGTVRWQLPCTFSTFDYRTLCGLLWEQAATPVRDRQGRRAAPARRRPHRPRRPARAARSSTRSAGAACSDARRTSSRPRRGCRAGSRSTRTAPGDDLELWLDPRYVARGLRLVVPRAATRCASASARSTRATTSRSRPCASPSDLGVPRRAATRATGSRTRCARRPRTASSSSATRAGHCLPLTAEGIRTAFYFGIAAGRELRGGARRARRPASRRSRATAAFSARARVEVRVDEALAGQRLAPASQTAGRARRAR